MNRRLAPKWGRPKFGGHPYAERTPLKTTCSQRRMVGLLGAPCCIPCALRIEALHMPVDMLRWYCLVCTSQLRFAVCAARLSALSTDHSRCANSCLFCNSSVFLLSSALSPSDPCFSARQSWKKCSCKLTIFCEAALRGRSTAAQTPRRASRVSCAAASSTVR